MLFLFLFGLFFCKWQVDKWGETFGDHVVNVDFSVFGGNEDEELVNKTRIDCPFIEGEDFFEVPVENGKAILTVEDDEWLVIKMGFVAGVEPVGGEDKVWVWDGIECQAVRGDAAHDCAGSGLAETDVEWVEVFL